MAAEKTEKPLKPKFAKIEKQNIGWGWFGTADDEYGHKKVVRCIIDR